MLRKQVLLLLPLLLCSCEKKQSEVHVIYDDYGIAYTEDMLKEAFYHENVSSMSYGYQIDARPSKETYDKGEKIDFEVYVGNNQTSVPTKKMEASLVYSIRAENPNLDGYHSFPNEITSLDGFFEEGKYQVNHSYISEKKLAFDYYQYHTSFAFDIQPYASELINRICYLDFGIRVKKEVTQSYETYYLSSFYIAVSDIDGKITVR